MPKNKGKGGKNRRRGKGDRDGKRELEFKDDMQEYAQVMKMLGNARIEAFCFDGVKRMCQIRGKMRKRIWINIGDIVLVSKRSFQDEKGDVILKYSADEARNLKQYGELPAHVKLNETDFMGADESDSDGVEFADYDESAPMPPVSRPAASSKAAAAAPQVVTVPITASGGIDLDAI